MTDYMSATGLKLDNTHGVRTQQERFEHVKGSTVVCTVVTRCRSRLNEIQIAQKVATFRRGVCFSICCTHEQYHHISCPDDELTTHTACLVVGPPLIERSESRHGIRRFSLHENVG